MKLSEKISITISGISLIGFILSGIFGELTASIIALGILMISGFYFLHSKYTELSETIKLSQRKSLLKDFPYQPKYEYLEEYPVRVNKKEKRIITQSDFLNWNEYTIAFWVNIEEDIFSSSNNKYLFSYYSEKIPDYNYKNSLYLGIKRTNLKKDEPEWRLILNGEDYEKQEGIYFPSTHSLVGWKHIVITWNKSSKSFRLYIDGGNVVDRSIRVESDCYPSSVENELFYFGGWKNWAGGLSNLNFYHIRIFADSINQGVAKELFELEKPYINKLKQK